MITGCAAVNPQPDYNRATQVIAAATGAQAKGIYRPDNEAVIKGKVADLLAGGITATEAVQLCLINNPKLQAAFFNIGVASAEVVQSRLFSNPTLALSPRFPDGGGSTTFEASIAQNIADLWLIPVRQRAAQHRLDQAVLELAHEVNIIALDAKATYFKAARADRELALTRENVEITKQLADLARVREEAGVGTILDVNLADSELLQLELAFRAATVSRIAVRTELTKLLGLPLPPEDLHLSDSLPDPPQWTLHEERLIELARAHRLDLQAATNAVRAAEARTAEERRKALRVIEVGGVRDAEDRSGLALSIELPLFDQNQAQVAVAEAQAEQAKKTHDALVLELTQETRLTYERAHAAWANTRFYQEKVLPLREGNLALSREAYRYGRASFLAVLEAERKLLDARAGYLEALQNSSTALVDLERVTGQPIANILATATRKTP